MPRFIDVHLEPCVAAQDGLSLRFKAAGEPRPVGTVPYESEAGVGGQWRVVAVASDETGAEQDAIAVPVEDSSDGTAWLVIGGSGGLSLRHVATGDSVREPYLLLSIASELGDP